MNKDLERFENRSDDWLAKERKRENRISAWDIDEGKKIKESHRENCEAQEIKKLHEKVHSGQINPEHKKQNSGFIITIIMLTLIAIDVIPTIITKKDITIIPLGIIGTMVFTYSLIYLIQRRRH